MVLESLVRSRRQVHVIPAHPTVVAPDDEIVPERVDCEARDPPRRTLELLDHLLLGEVVDPHVSLGRDEEERLGRVERHRLHVPLGLAERQVRLGLGGPVDLDGELGRVLGRGREVVALVVPHHAPHTLFDLYHHAVLVVVLGVFASLPLDGCLFFLGNSGQQLLGRLCVFARACVRVEERDLVASGHREDRNAWVGVPRDSVDEMGELVRGDDTGGA
eukprot:1365675-Amorphochlora_amoeboformis.AAC.1